VSQILDSLRRSRKSDTRSTQSRTSHGDAVLTTLGYAAPVRRKQYRPILAGGLILAIAATAWIGWRAYLDLDATPAPSPRVLSPAMPKPAPPVTRSPATQALPGAPPEGAEPVPETAGISNVGRRAVHRAATSTSPVPNPGLRPFESLRVVPSPVEGRQAQAAASLSRGGSRTPDPDKAGASAPSPADDLELALYYHRTGDYEKALQRYRAVLERNELNAQAHNNLGLLYQERNLLQDSARELQRAVVLEPRNAGTRNNYGVTLLMLGELDHAAAEFQTALWLEPQNVDALINLSLVQRKTGQLDTAKETLLRVLNIAPTSAPAHYNLAQLYDDTNERARAVEHYRLFLDNAGAEHANRAPLVRARIAALNTMSK
jgi:Tfp pilus assembly protein PilF